MDGTNNFSSLTSASSDGPWLWDICSVFMYFLSYEFCCTDPCLMLDMGSCFLFFFMILAWCVVESSMRCTCFHDLSCYVLRSLCCMLMGYSCVTMHVVFWDPFYAMLMVCSSCMSFVIMIWVLLTEISCSGTSLGATPTWGNFPCMIAMPSLMYIISIGNT